MSSRQSQPTAEVEMDLGALAVHRPIHLSDPSKPWTRILNMELSNGN